MSSQAARTGESNCPDCEQKWQSSGAAAGLDADDPLDLDLRPAPAQAHLVRQRQQVGQRFVGEQQAVERLRSVETDAIAEHLVTRGREDVVHRCPLRVGS